MPIKSIIRETISFKVFVLNQLTNFLSALALKSFRTIVLTLVVGNVAILENIGIPGLKGNLNMFPYGTFPL